MGREAPVVALCGGVGAARFLCGLVRAVPPEQVVAVVNTGDDRVFYGAHVSPDLDIVGYTLAGLVDRTRGFGIEGDRFELVDALAALGHEAWFRLGDRDYAHCLHRRLRLASGASLTEVSDELRRHLGVRTRLLPMSDAPCPTVIERLDGTRAHFEEYLVRDGAPADVADVDLSAARAADPAPGVLDAIAAARCVIVCPSNPVVSIGPILALRGVRAAVAASAAPVIGVSPIVGGAPVKGPADHLLRAIGVEVSARGVARHYGALLDGFVLDHVDAEELADVEAAGIRGVASETLMRDPEVAAELARTVLALAERAA